ncbi:accessory Sec system protein Asp2 [Eupransor demetentiae]|uniref:DUF1100 family (FrsA) n=1 Tax=Eupransor demetentiae TaxID=3109584 RepID=A0ABM9N4S2_9LACO|nr:DUF1100 family (FrsA) [Lactobacillaceae bacterium LMG 33000]
MADISILQIGAQDWTAQVANLPLEWHHTTLRDLPTYLTKQVDPFELEENYVLLTDEVLDSTLLAQQIRKWPAYRVVYIANPDQINFDVKAALAERRAMRFGQKTPETVGQRIVRDLYIGQIGFPTRFSEEQYLPQTDYRWTFERHGRFSTLYEGDFGNDWTQVGTLKTFPGDFAAGQDNWMYLDYQSEGGVQVALEFVFFQNGRLQQLQILEGDALRQMAMVKAPEKYQDYQILVLLKGQGKIDLHALHQRRSRHGLGLFIPGGQRELTDDGQEVLSYYNPGTKKGPLIILFAGTRLHIEGFEMMGPLNKLGYPYLLFTDSRTQGGAFDVGSEAYEAVVLNTIEKAMREADVTPDQVIMSGYSMGSYPAMYYLANVDAGALIVAKPIMNLGTFTASPEFPHNGLNRDWTLDVRRFLAGRMSPDDSEMMDAQLWQKLDKVNWAGKDVALFTMSEDEYDGKSLPQLLSFLKDKGVNFDHKVEKGFHEQKIDEMVKYMIDAMEKEAIKMMGRRTY